MCTLTFKPFLRSMEFMCPVSVLCRALNKSLLRAPDVLLIRDASFRATVATERWRFWYKYMKNWETCQGKLKTPNKIWVKCMGQPDVGVGWPAESNALFAGLSLSITLRFVISISVQPTDGRLANFHTFYVTMASHSPEHWSQPTSPMDMRYQLSL